MSRARWFCGCLLSLMAGVLSNCGDGGADDCGPGQEGCECLQGQCFGALQCLSDVCVDPNAGTTPAQPTTDDPTNTPTDDPTNTPTNDPTNTPTNTPTSDPTSDPTNSDPTNSDPTTTDPTTGPPVDDTTTTDDPPDDTTTTGEPKPNDPQPESGMWSDCFNKRCDLSTDGCFTVTQGNMKIDGICSNFCTRDEECLPAPYSQAVPTCQKYTADKSGCVLRCQGSDAECPIGMTCRDLTLFGEAIAVCS